MSRTARSVQVFGFYLAALGATLVLWPNFLLAAFGFVATEEVWIRVLGMVLVILSVYYLVAARYELRPICAASVGLRSSALAFFLVFVAFRLAPPQLLLFAGGDLAGALWTYWALRRDARAAA